MTFATTTLIVRIPELFAPSSRVSASVVAGPGRFYIRQPVLLPRCEEAGAGCRVNIRTYTGHHSYIQVEEYVP